MPAFVSTLWICIVFVLVVFITGAAKSCSVLLALAVVFAMLYVVLPVAHPGSDVGPVPAAQGIWKTTPTTSTKSPPPGLRGAGKRLLAAFERGFERFRTFYGGWLAFALHNRLLAIGGFAVFVAGSLALLPLVGRDFFPTVDAGLIKLHVRGAPGTRIEETEQNFSEIERTIRDVIPKQEIGTLIDILGTPYSGLNLSLSEGALVSSADGQIYIALKGDHAPTVEYVRKLRAELNRTYPESTFFFLAPDISTQVLNFGIAAPIDVQVIGGLGKDAGNLRRLPGSSRTASPRSPVP